MPWASNHPQIYLIGANHTSAPIELREKLYIPPDKLTALMPELKKLFGFLELYVLSTCNRFELVGVANADSDIQKRLFDAYMYLQETSENIKKFSEVNLQDSLYTHENGKAVKHIYRVVSSLDSLVLGETQITGQFKNAIQLALSVKTLGPLLNRLSQDALSTAKKVRSQTDIGKKHVSISHAALDLAKKVFGDLGDHKFLIVGAGEMGRIAAKNILQYSPKDLFIANRSIANAERLVEEIGFGNAYKIDEIPNILPDVDVVICSTSSTKLILNREMIKRAQSNRRSRPLILLDIALPRNIDPEIATLDDVYLFDIDDLQQVVGANFEERRKAAIDAESLIDYSVVGYEHWLASFDIKPIIADFRTYINNLIQQEMTKTLGKPLLKDLSEAQTEAIASMQAAIANKITGDVSRQIKCPPEGFFKEQLADAVKILFTKK